jgi:hypothetical protein
VVVARELDPLGRRSLLDLPDTPGEPEAAGEGIKKVAMTLGVGNGTVSRSKAAMAA